MDKNFGFRKVNAQQKESLVKEVFSDVAENYDIMNDLMSLGIHRLWKDEFCSMIPNLNSKILDVAGGTGDIAFRLHKKAKKLNANSEITICDINPEMLQEAKKKAVDKNILSGIEFTVGDAMNLPFTDNSFDYYTIAFGIRNVVTIETALKEANRVLKPGGKFLCLEFSKLEHNFMQKAYDLYSFNILPFIGKHVARNQDAYKYLAESISLFPDQETFKKMIYDAGFIKADYKNLSCGIASIHYGYKV